MKYYYTFDSHPSLAQPLKNVKSVLRARVYKNRLILIKEGSYIIKKKNKNKKKTGWESDLAGRVDLTHGL